MTAEIAILNRSAAALAADSAVTLATDMKVYQTANKLLPLSFDPPIVMMLYGAGSLGSIPWETVVEEYRREHESDSFATVREYGQHFVDFLSQMVIHISSQTQTGFVRSEILWEIEQLSRFALRNLGDFVRVHPGRLPTENLGYLFDQIRDGVGSRLDYLMDLPAVEGMTDRVAKQQFDSAMVNWNVGGQQVNGWNELLDLWFSQQPELLMHGVGDLPSDVRRSLKNLALRSLVTADWSPDSSGLVIVGFGYEQIFPSLDHWLVDQVMNGVIKSRRLENIQIDDANPSAIVPFAQQNDVARTLIDGIHPVFLAAHHDILIRSLGLLTDAISDLVQSTVPNAWSSRLSGLFADLSNDVFQTVCDEFGMMAVEYAAPMLEIVEGLPKEHLGEMAETLVHLASFKEKFTPGADVVGGPIDVAVISRSDGLVWVKHKQYYESEL